MEIHYPIRAKLVVTNDQRSFSWMRKSYANEDLGSMVGQLNGTPTFKVEGMTKFFLYNLVTKFDDQDIDLHCLNPINTMV